MIHRENALSSNSPTLDGCGDRLSPYPVELECPHGSPRIYERDPSKIAVLSLRFSSRETLKEEHLAAAISGIASKEPTSLEVIATKGATSYQVCAQVDDVSALKARFTSSIPGLSALEIAPKNEPVFAFLSRLRELKKDRRPRFLFRDFIVPAPWHHSLERPQTGHAAAILESLTTISNAAGNAGVAGVQFLLQPVSHPWAQEQLAALQARLHFPQNDPITGRPKMTRDNEVARQIEAFKRRCSSPFLAASVRLFVFAFGETAYHVLKALESAFQEYRRPFDHKSLFALDDKRYDESGATWQHRIHAIKNRVTYTTGMILTARELSLLVPLPVLRNLEDPAFGLEPSGKTVPVPPRLSEGVLIGENEHRAHARGIYLSDQIRNRHLYLVGKTRTGKSTLIQNLIAEDLAAGHGVGVLDPEGELIKKILALVPPERCRDVVLFDAADRDFAFSFNLLNLPAREKRHRRIADLMETLERVIPGGFGERMKRLLTDCLDLLLCTPGTTLRDVPRLFADPAYRSDLVENARDIDDTDELVTFWVQTFPRQEQTLQSSIDGIDFRLKDITRNPAIRDLTCQSESRLDFAQVIAKRQIFLANLASYDEASNVVALLGQALVSEIQIAGMRREPHSGPHFYLYVDEFQNYATNAFEKLLSQGAKYRINLTLAHQYTEQLPRSMRDAILGNVGAVVAFQLGIGDASLIARDFGKISPDEITSLQRFHAWLKVESDVFNARFRPPPEDRATSDDVKRMIDHSRSSYAKLKTLLGFARTSTSASSNTRKAETKKPTRRPLQIDESFEEI